MARPQSARAHVQVLDAALKLFAERGIEATSMDAIAEASGVSKATIYNHWPDKDALCLEVLTHLHGKNQPRLVPDSGDARADLVAALRQQPHQQHTKLCMRIMPHLMAYACRNPSFGKAWRNQVFEPPRVQITQLLERCISRGQLPRDLDRDLAIALLLGPIMYAHMLERMHSEAPENLTHGVVDAFWKAHALASPKQRGRRTSL